MRTIFKQPNGKYGIYSTSINNFLGWDMEPAEVIEVMAKTAAEAAKGLAVVTIDMLDEDEDPHAALRTALKDFKKFRPDKFDETLRAVGYSGEFWI